MKLKKLNKNVLSNAGVRFTDDILIPLYENNENENNDQRAKFTLKDFISGAINHLKTTHSDVVEKIGFEISFDQRFTSSQKEKQLKCI